MRYVVKRVEGPKAFSPLMLPFNMDGDLAKREDSSDFLLYVAGHQREKKQKGDAGLNFGFISGLLSNRNTSCTGHFSIKLLDEIIVLSTERIS